MVVILAPLVILWEAQGIVVDIGERVCRAIVIGFGHLRCSRRLAHTALVSTMAV